MNKKLLVTLSLLAATGAMALAGCKGSGSGTDTGDTTSTDTTPTVPVDPISDIEVSEPSEDIVVGDVIDLDTLINVVGGSDPKGYEVTVRPASADVVSVAGHTLTVLKEGPIELKVTAGDESALVSWESLSALRAQYKAATTGVNKNFGLRDASVSETGNVTLDGDILVHNEEYFYQVYTSGKTKKGSGLALLHDGFIYNYTTDGTEAAGNLEFTAKGKRSGDSWENYFVNMGFAAGYDLFETASVEAADGSSVEYLSIPASAEVPAGYEDYAGNLADYVSLLTFGNSAYLLATDEESPEPLDPSSVYFEIEPLTSATGEVSYLLASYVEGAAGGKYAGKTMYLGMSILDVDMHIQSIEDYIASEVYPEAISAQEVTSFVSNLAAAKSYTQQTVIAGYSQAGAFLSGSQLNLSSQVAYDGINKVFMNMIYDDVNGENLADMVYYFEYNDVVYQVAPNDDGELDAAALDGVAWSTVEGAVTAQTWTGVSTAGLVASDRTVDTENETVLVTCADSGSYAFVKAFVGALPGYGQMFVGHMEGYEGNATMKWSVANDLSSALVTVRIPVNYGAANGIPTAQTMIYGIGETNLSELKARLIALVAEPEVSID